MIHIFIYLFIQHRRRRRRRRSEPCRRNTAPPSAPLRSAAAARGSDCPTVRMLPLAAVTRSRDVHGRYESKQSSEMRFFFSSSISLAADRPGRLDPLTRASRRLPVRSPIRNVRREPPLGERESVRIVKSREGQVKSCNNVDEKRSVGREALITVYPTVREVVDSGASRFAYLAFVRICIRRVPRIRSTGADDSAAAAKKPKATAVGGGGGVVKKPKAKPTHPKTSEMVNNAIRELKERSGSSLQAIKKYIAAQYKVDAEKHAPS
ncbi:Histone H1 [Eumeta japonica]|uniref:Histone H1 n=1 Tax=Eumeta variegata TaxID=151549 RepID=A0A4C1XEY9_EUMVA|nr:Histone H1 [Eumeta japonica]